MSKSSSANKKTSKKTETLDASTEELARLMQANPGALEKPLLIAGNNLVGIFFDENITTRRFADIKEKQIETIKKSIEDISGGVMILRSSTIGLAYRDGQISSYVSPHGTLPSGNVIFSVSWKNLAAFKAWRFGEGDDISQDEINAAIYYLTSEIAKLM